MEKEILNIAELAELKEAFPLKVGDYATGGKDFHSLFKGTIKYINFDLTDSPNVYTVAIGVADTSMKGTGVIRGKFNYGGDEPTSFIRENAIFIYEEN